MTANKTPAQVLVERATQDPKVRADLLAAPRETVERLLGIKIPIGVSVEVLEAKPDQFFLVLPPAGGYGPACEGQLAGVSSVNAELWG